MHNIVSITEYLDVRHELKRSFDELLDRWGDGRPPGINNPSIGTGLAKVLAAIEGLDHALDRLGNRDREGLKAKLSEQRDTLVARVTALESLAGTSAPIAGMRKFQPVGPRFRDLADRFMAADQAVLAARRRMNEATRDTVLACRQDVDLAEADLREASREIEVLREAAAFPPLPKDLCEAIVQAEQQTKELARLAGIKSQPARALRTALEQGATASRSIAELWICFESAKDVQGDLYAWRWRSYSEGG